MSGVSRARRDGLQRDFISDAGELSEGGIWGEGERTTCLLRDLRPRANIWDL